MGAVEQHVLITRIVVVVFNVALQTMGCIGSKLSMKKDNDLETPLTGHETPTRQLSLRKQLSQKKEVTLTRDPSLKKKDPSQGEFKSDRSKDETSMDKEVEVGRGEDVNIVINENFDWDVLAQDTRTTSEKERELPRTPTPSPSPSLRKRPTPLPSPSLRKSPAFQMRGRRLSEGNTSKGGSSFRKMINQALSRHSMSQSLDVTSVAPLLSSQISEDKDELLTKDMMLEWKTPNVGFDRLLATKAGLKLFDNFPGRSSAARTCSSGLPARS